MKLISRFIKPAGAAVLFLLLQSVPAYASGGMAAVETYTGASEISIYLKGVSGDLSDVQVQAGTAVCDSVTKSRLSETGQPVKTLVMLDNSLSITKADRKRILKIIKNLISGRMENEKMALAVFNEGMAYLAGYTSDDAVLKDAVNEITYQSSHTYLTDVLYDFISDEVSKMAEDEFRRIIVISDGMDNKSIGYTKDELYGLLEEYPLPIYTIGAQTAKKDNNEQLKNMFAISRLTGADSFVLDEVEDLKEISRAVNEDKDIVKLVIRPSDELMDGSKKTIKIMLASGENISTQIVMPQKAADDAPASKETETDSAAAQPQSAADKADSAADDAGKQKDSAGTVSAALIAACLLAAAALAAAVFWMRRKKKQNAAQDAGGRTEQTEHAPADDAEQTEMLDETAAFEEEGDTVYMWNGDASSACRHIVLTDISTPVKTFQAPLRGSVVIGRKQGACGITIDYDRSISGRHCEITARDGKFYISDLQSSNGTFVDDCEVLSETELAAGSIIKMGKSAYRFEVK